MSPAATCSTITLSPAMDITLACETFPAPGDVLAGGAEVETPGGKGLNVARWLAARGHTVVAAGLLGRENAAPFEALMAAPGIRDAFVRVPGANRRNVMVTTPQGMFKINRRAFPNLRATDWSRDRVLEPCLTTSTCVLAGSLPAAIPDDVYAGMIKRLRSAGVATVLDTSGKALACGIEANPDVIKPNRRECAELLGVSLQDGGDFRNACLALLDRAACVLISDGAGGCWFADRADGGRVFHASSPDVDVVDTTAAGDALLAEFCHGYFPDHVLDEGLMRQACAAGAAATTQPGAATPPMARVSQLVEQVQVAVMV